MKSICQTLHGPLGISRYHSWYLPRSSAARFPQIVFWTGRNSREALFVALLVSPQQYFMNAIILSVDHWFNACTIIRNGNLKISHRISLLFNLNQSFVFFLIKPVSFGTTTEIWLFLWKQHLGHKYQHSGFLFASRESSLTCPGISIISKASSKVWQLINFGCKGNLKFLPPLEVGNLIVFIASQSQGLLQGPTDYSIGINVCGFALG